MPTAYVNKLSDKYDIPIKTLEKLWKDSEQLSSDKKNYAIITNIFKAKLKKEFNINETKEINLLTSKIKIFLNI